MNMIEAMEIYVAVVEQGSYTRAAESLRLHRPALSKAIQNLEQELNVQLLHRTTRKIHVTPEGEEFYDRCKQLLADLSDTVAWFSPDRPARGKLRVDVPVTLAKAFIIPSLPQFRALYPEIELILGSSDHQVDLIAQGVDCAVRLGELDSSSLIAKRIGTVPMVTCAAPSYLEQYGTPTTFEALSDHLAVNFLIDHRQQIMPWRFQIGGESLSVTLKSGIVVDDSQAFLCCGLAGLGIVQGLRPSLQPHIASGELIEILPDLHTVPKPVSLLLTDRKYRSPKVRAFMEWLVAVFAEQGLS
ncbi:D-malate degradation protein R [Pseudomonas sp. 31 R 17]|uniref:LysR family transcriptional regulator n=1 Tax=Pseudomonas sp. 31 R 17 TaxID=1844101 RepID=UPI00081289E9|nr:LysR family transcriptional regulator [Pseudomonas sp. 31 R 17]CRM81606.1 D-malate degradation protein R [Pseudomonas sp. 31 R 17]